MSSQTRRDSVLKAMANPLVLLLARCLLGGVFMFAGWLKFASPRAFADSIGGFKLLHDSILLEVGLLFIWAELICGLAMVIGLATRAAAGIATVMLLSFIFAMVSAVARGLEIECGCFGALLPEGVNVWSVVRTALLLLPSIIVTANGAGRVSLDGLLGRSTDQP